MNDVLQNDLKQPHRFRPMAAKQITQQFRSARSPLLHSSSSEPGLEQYKSYLNFLRHPGIVKANLIPDKSGNISFTLPEGKYSNLYIIVADMENVSQIQLELPSHLEELKKRELALTKPLDPKKNYNEVRNVHFLSKGDKHKIKDLTSVGYNIIDCLEKVRNVQLEIAKMDGYDICPDLLFLTNWDSLSYEDQIKKYTKYICHETHLFLYFKDRPFFDKVIKPFIMNKLEKSFIDHWLLGNYDTICEVYTSVEYYDNLNSVEKILLIHMVVQNDIGMVFYQFYILISLYRDC